MSDPPPPTTQNPGSDAGRPANLPAAVAGGPGSWPIHRVTATFQQVEKRLARHPLGPPLGVGPRIAGQVLAQVGSADPSASRASVMKAR